jgi:GAF domain-containing protein
MPTADFFHRYLYALADIHASFSLETTEAAVVRNAALLFSARGASIMIFNPSEESLVISATFGLSEAYRAKGAISPRQSLGETVQRAPVVVRDVATDPKIQYREATLQEGIVSIVGLPLTAGSALVGSLRLYFAQRREFSLEEMEHLQALALQAGLALKKAFYFASMKAAVSEIQGMPATNYKEALQHLVKIVAQYGHARSSALFLVDRKTNIMSSVVRYGLSERYLSKGPVFLGVSLGEVTSGQPVVISKAASDPRVQYKEAAAAENIQAILGLPVRIGSEIAGALRLYYPFEFEPGPDYIMWMEHLAHHVGMALEKTRMLAKIHERANWYEEILKDFER